MWVEGLNGMKKNKTGATIMCKRCKNVHFKNEGCIYNPDIDPNCVSISNTEKENIRQQPHYTQFKIQPVVFIAENNLDFLTGNIIKYVLRHNLKNGIEDLDKAQHYLDMLKQKVRGEKVIP